MTISPVRTHEQWWRCRQYRLFIVSVLLIAAPLTVWAEALSIRFGHPAEIWEGQVLPIGNGALGAAVQGGVVNERLQFNEKTLWTGGPQAGDRYDFGVPKQSYVERLAEVRARLRETGSLKPEEVVAELGREVQHYGHYQSFGDLHLSYLGLGDEVLNYQRELDLERGVASVTFEHRGVRYQREYFASFPDQAIVVRISANQPGKVSLDVGMSVPDNRSAERQWRASGLGLQGTLHDNGLAYAAELDLEVQGGEHKANQEGEVWQVRKADAVVIRLTAATGYRQSYPDYRGSTPGPKVTEVLRQARRFDYAQMMERHLKDYQRLFGRVRLDLGQEGTEKTTPELLASYRQGNSPGENRALESLYFQFGRYLLIASSRDGSLPANLQGVWNQSKTPPWNADYHVNINLQMNYWPAEVANLAETTGPLFDFVDGLIEPGRESARQFYGAEGWTLFLNTNIWGFTGVIDWPTAFWQPEAGAWLAQHYYEHYRFNQDKQFLEKRAYPVMRAATQFWLDALVKDASEKYWLVTPSYSPEHGDFTEGAAMSQQLVWDLFRNTHEAANLLGDTDFALTLKHYLDDLDPGLRIGRWGQLQEWREDRDEQNNQHRHVSHLFALHPGRQITAAQPELLDAARTTLNARGDGGTGWAQAWKVNLWARLHQGNRAHKVLADQLRDSTLANLWDTHPPFQIDGNFGATAGIAEMLLQSHGEVVHLLPALPDAWSSGSVSGLRARGDITVAMDWKAGDLDSATLTSGITGTVSVRIGSENNEADVQILDSDGEAVEVQSVMSGESSIRQWSALAGQTYRLRLIKRSDVQASAVAGE